MDRVPLFRASERTRVTGATFLVLSALAAFLLFDKPIAVVVTCTPA